MHKATSDKKVVIVGAGPAGLTAAYELSKFDVCPTVLEKAHIVGGLARTRSHMPEVERVTAEKCK